MGATIILKKELFLHPMNLIKFTLLCGLLLIIFGANLFFGSVHIAPDDIFDILFQTTEADLTASIILIESRLPQAITALIAGCSLAVSGLLLQSIFNNPLAGPSVLGIDAGASLGVAIVMLLFGGELNHLPQWLQPFEQIPILGSALAGSFLVLSVILFFSSFIKSNLMLLIIGIMVGYFTSALISVLNFFSDAQGVQAYTLWGMGDFSNVSLMQLPEMSAVALIGIAIAFFCLKPLNTLLLGGRYAESLGIKVNRTRLLLLIATGILTAITTAYCGPISFIGLVVPHMARLAFKSSNQYILLPGCCIIGATLTLSCNLISNLPGGSGIIPLNAITPIIGAPIVLYIIMYQQKIEYFN